MTNELHHQLAEEKTHFGFWIYLMTDLLMFAALFAAYIVLHNNTFGGPGSQELFKLPTAMTETMILLVSSFTSGLGMIAALKGHKKATLAFFAVTFLLGAAFLFLEVSEFSALWREGNTFQRNAFLSSFFTLVGTHGLHITSGLLWMILVIIQIARKGLTTSLVRKVTLLSLFWHFLDVVWIFIFSIVYLLGVI